MHLFTDDTLLLYLIGRGLFQFSQCFFDTTDRFNYIFIAGGIAHTDAFGSTERSTAYTRYMGILKQIHRQIIRILNLTIPNGFAKERTAF